MSFSFLSAKFVLFAVTSVFLLTLLRGLPRQAVFLFLNVSFLWLFVLGPVGTLSTIIFSLFGYVLVQMHFMWGRLKIAYTLPLLVGIFLYMRDYEILHWVLPSSVLTDILSTIGLSFLFFKIIHVIVDVRGDVLDRPDFLTYINYCLNFTTFVMGPIQRFHDYRDQWTGKKNAIELTFEAHLDAVIRIVFGLIKAYILAQLFYTYALKPDTDILGLDAVSLLIQAYCFFFYLYLNFSGYCDIVIGIGSLFGVRPPENFNLPFIAQNISDFWLRQHRSLTLWLTDYVFSPAYKRGLGSTMLSGRPVMAGNIALLVTMLVSGIWHGTTIGFLIFGLMHGVYLVIYHSWDHLLASKLGKKNAIRLRKHWISRVIGIVLTFNATSFAFIFFQVDTPSLMASIGRLS